MGSRFAAARQLGLLLWKNALLKWRGGLVKIGCCGGKSLSLPVFLIEIIWPVLLYFIILALRLKFPAENIDDSIYRPNALPSAGLLPFMQTIMCDVGIGPTGERSDMPQYPNASVNELYAVLDDVGMWSGRWSDVCSSVQSLVEEANCANLTLRLASCTKSDGSIPVDCILQDPTEFREFLSGTLNISNETVNGILNSTIKPEASQLPLDLTSCLPLRAKRQLTPIAPVELFLSPFFLKSISCNQECMESVLEFGPDTSLDNVTQSLCNLSESDFELLSEEMRKQLQACSLFEQVQEVSELLALQEAITLSLTLGGSSLEYSNITSFLCGELAVDEEIVNATLARFEDGDSYQQAVKDHEGDEEPIKVALKVLYTPNNNLTRSIMKKANQTFANVEYFRNWAEQVVNCSQYFLDNFPPDSPQVVALRQTIDYLLYNGSGQDNPSLSKASLLLSDEPGNIWEIVNGTKNSAEMALGNISLIDWDIFYPVDNEEFLEDLAHNYDEQKRRNITTVAAGIVFDHLIGPNGEELSGEGDLRKATVRIRMNSTYVHDTTVYKETVWRPGPEDDAWKRRYLEAWFIHFQDMVERGLMEQISGEDIPTPGLYLQQMPYPCYKLDRFTGSMLWLLPLSMIFAWLFPIAMTVRAIVREKETRIREFMKMMGLSEGVLRLSWFITSVVILSISVVLITIILKAGGILAYCDWLILFLYLLLYAIVSISYSFLVSAFFTNANVGACVAALLYFLVFFGHVTLVPRQQLIGPLVLGLCCLWAPLAFGIGASYLVQYEMKQVGLHWYNINETAIPDDQLTFLVVCVMLVLDTFLYTLLTWYIEGVFPGKYGVAKPFYFPFQRSYWLGQRGSAGRGVAHHVRLQEEEMTSPVESGEQLMVENEGAVCEDEPEHLTAGISIRNLSKHYISGWWWKRKKVEAVKNLSLNFYEGHITAFLGHNGAGKTTTMSLLTGLYEPTSGTAHIYGDNIRQHMDIIRQSMGMCPQHNILFDNLTVREHLLFFSLLKGLSVRKARDEIPEWLSKVDLLPEANKLAKHLSGGMKRKLSILLAFVGKSRTIILDEPTSGVDTFARRQIWDFLQRHRHGRTIMLSTHHMDEAELLGERIAIISNGSLVCCGSFEFLRGRFGRGHRLTLVTSSRSSRRGSSSSHTFTVTVEMEETDSTHPTPDHTPSSTYTIDNNIDKITTFIQGFIPSANLEEHRGRELHYLLPLLQAKPSVLERLFDQLELKKDLLSVTSYGLTACSMEEIFVQLTEQEDLEKMEDAAVPRRTSIDDVPKDREEGEVHNEGDDGSVFDEEGLLFGDASCEDPLGSTPREKRLKGPVLWLSQYTILLVKRFLYSRRKLIPFLVQNVLPLVIIILSLGIAQMLQDVPDPPRLELHPSLFLIDNQYNYIVVGSHSNDSRDYDGTLYQPCGIGAHTLDPDSRCASPVSNRHCSHYPHNQFSCSCHTCPDEDLFPTEPPPCYSGAVTGSRLQNLTVAYNSSELAYEMLTTYFLRSKQAFIESRYGGVSFGHSRDDIDPYLDEVYNQPNVSLPFLATHSTAKVWYSLKGYHAMPSYLNVMNNALLRANLEDKDMSKYGIRTYSHPFKMTRLQKMFYSITEKASFLINPLAAIFALGFVAAGFILMLIEEKTNNVKHLQMVCGLYRSAYWLSSLTWDLVSYLLFIAVLLALYQAFGDIYFTPDDVFPIFVLLLLAYGVAIAPWMYVLAHLFRSPATAYVTLFCLNYFSGFALLIVDAILLYLSGVYENENGNYIQYWLTWLPFPSYSLARGMMYFSGDRPLQMVLTSFTFAPVPDAFDAVWPFVFALLVQAAVYFTILVLIELSASLPRQTSSKNPFSLLFRFIRSCRQHSFSSLPIPTDEEPAVARERQKVSSHGHTKGDILTLNNLTKVYNSGWGRKKNHKVAVNHLCLAVQKSECFGLLGVNGAGKTTTFRMLTGDTGLACGDAVIASHSVLDSIDQVRQSIGYCPQVDALIDPLTGRQHLVLFSRLRGLSPKEVDHVAEWALLKLGLQEYADKPAGAYSGGNRRKLSTAIALLARPPLILLDEPTSGVDPRAKQFLWNIIKGLVSAGQSVVLTTHSMAECEALCSRVGIMVNGTFQCLGTPQQLKSTYGEGYRLKIRTIHGSSEPVKEYVEQNFLSSVLKEQHYNILVYQLPQAGLQLSKVFRVMEEARESLDSLEDYSVSQTSLDDVFIHFASQQKEDVELCSDLPDIVADEKEMVVKYSVHRETVSFT